MAANGYSHVASDPFDEDCVLLFLRLVTAPAIPYSLALGPAIVMQITHVLQVFDLEVPAREAGKESYESQSRAI